MSRRPGMRLTGFLATIAMAATALSWASVTEAKDAIKFRLDWTVYGTHAPFFLAQERGYYAAENVDVTIAEGQGSATVVRLIGAGTEDMAFIDYGTMVKAVAQGVGVKAVFGINQNSPMIIISHKDNPVRKPQDLIGKTIAMAPAESSAQIFPAILTAAKIEPSQVKIVSPGTGAKAALFRERKVDAITGYINVEAATLELAGVDMVYLPFADNGANVMSNGIVANSAFLEKNANAVRGFLKAVTKAWQDTQKEPEAAIDAMIKRYPDRAANRALYLRQLQLSIPTLQTTNTKGKPLGWMSDDDWKSTQTILATFAGLEKTTDVSRYFTNDFVPAGK